MRAVFAALRSWQRQAMAALALMLVCLLLLYLQAPAFGPAFKQQGAASDPITLPMHIYPPTPATYTFAVTVRSALWGPTYIRVVADDCVVKLSYDGAPIAIDGVPGTCDFRRGFSFEVPSGRGEHRLEATIKDDGGAAAFELFAAYRWAGIICCAMLIASLAGLVFALATALGLPLFARVAALVGAIVRISYMLHTPWWERSHDVDEHLVYVRRMVANFLMPRLDSCWECYHPPTYFGLAALWVRATGALRLSPTFALQVLALLFSLVFLLFGLVAIVQAMVCRRSTNASQAPVWLAVSLFSLWPSAILHAPRLGNDAPFYAFSAVSMALTALWWRHREDRYLVWALLVAGGAMLTKSNGIVLVATIATLVVFTLWIERETSDRAHAWRTAVRAGLASLAAVVPPMALGWVRAAMAGSDALVGNSATINPALAVPNDLGHYVYVPLDTWLIEPFTDAGDDRKGRTFFWNYFGKTSLFGEFHLGSDPTRHNIAVAISALLVVLVVLLIRGLLRARRHDALWAIPLLLWLAAAVAFRARYPYSCSGDFRYVLPVLIPLCVGVASGLDHLRNPKVRWLAGASVIAFALLSGALTASIDAWP